MHFYSYLWLREDGTPYYAGKGTRQRAFQSRGHGALNCPKIKARILVFPMLNEDEAFESEIALIELFGRKDLGTGCLRNLTDGGDGIRGYTYTPDHRAKLSAAHKGRTQSRALVTRRAKALKQYWETKPDCRIRNAKIAAKANHWFATHTEDELRARKEKMTRAGTKHTAKAREKMSQARQGRTPNKGHHHSAEARAKMSAAHMRRKENGK